MITPEELRQLMLETGFPVTARRLTDWRSKGLLPPLASRGQGKGRGKINFWNEPDILVRAQFVHHAFAHGATAEIVTLSLVHGGFDVAPKKARRTWIKYLAKLERLSENRIEPGESPRDAFWDQGVQMARKISEQRNISKNIIEPLTAETLLTIYARRRFRPNSDELNDITRSAKQFVTAAMTDARHRRARRVLRILLSRNKFIKQSMELLRQGISVTATKELIRSTTTEQFDLAISTTRLIVRATETFITTQINGQTSGEPSLVIRMIFRAIVGPTITAFFLQLIGAGYERRLRKSLHLLEVFIATCEAHPGRTLSPENPAIHQELQQVITALFSEFKGIWRGFSLFRMYHIG
jgi:hypothetical protein